MSWKAGGQRDTGHETDDWCVCTRELKTCNHRRPCGLEGTVTEVTGSVFAARGKAVCFEQDCMHGWLLVLSCAES